MTTLVELLAWLEGDGVRLFWSGFLVFIRVGATLSLLPAFGEQSIPARVRLALGLLFTIVVAPAVATPVTLSATAILAEAVIGLLIGAGFRIFVLVLQTAGAIAAQATSLSQLFGGGGVEPQPAIGHLLVVAGLALAATMGLHVRAAEALILSYEVLPQGRLPTASDAASWGLGRIGTGFSLAFALAMPFVIGGLIYNAALGAINRAMPTLMVAFIGAPALTAGGLVLLAMTAPSMLAVWVQAFDSWLSNPFGLPR